MRRQEVTSLGQERIWSICQTYPDDALYHIGFSMYIVGNFCAELTERALNIIVERHESLRTTFAMINNELHQIIAPTMKLTIPIIHREDVQYADIANEIKLLAKTEYQKPFDLYHGPLIRSTLVKFANQHHGWLLTLHHAISDGWSVGLLAYEINLIYHALHKNQQHQVPKLTTQYSSYAHQQREKLKFREQIESLCYWENRLFNLPKVNLIKTDELNLDRHFVSISMEVVNELNQLSKQKETTLFTLFLIAFRIALWKQNNNNDCIITVPVADRNNFKMQKLIGYFINLLPIRLIIPEVFRFNEFLHDACNIIREDFNHADVPLEYLSKHFGFEEHHNNPLYKVLFSLQNYPVPTNIYNYEIIELLDYTDLTEFDLVVRVSTRKQSCELEIIYNQNYYDFASIQQLTKLYGEVLNTLSNLCHPEA